MIHIHALFGLCLVLAFASAQNFADYDYQDSYGPQPPARQPQRPSPPRSQFGPSLSRPTTTTTRAPPVAILKQINRHNDDGSYTYGYEAADGAFKIETKLVTGEVMGKYGYVDADGKLRTVEYGANRYGFQPAGEGITVPPPTLVDETTRKGPNGEPLEYEDNYFQPEERRQEPVRSAPQAAPRPRIVRPRPQPQPEAQPQPQYNDFYVAPTARAQPSFGPAPPRAVVPGAAPSSFGPAPPRAVIPGAAPSSFGPAPQSPPTFRPAPQAAPIRSAPRAAPVRENRPAPRGVLDDLAQQYAIPQGSRSTPLTDITFGSYSSQTSF